MELRRRFLAPRAAPLFAQELSLALDEALDRLLLPSLESEARRGLKQSADEEAIRVFARNLEALLLAPPLGPHPVLAIDPGLRTGCKVVALDGRGEVLAFATIYPHTGGEEEAAIALRGLLRKHTPAAVAVGNGTAGRETEAFVRKAAPAARVGSVSEAGASIYSASHLAREELPALDVSGRGAGAIGRRLQDPLAELGKLDPHSNGGRQDQ